MKVDLIPALLYKKDVHLRSKSVPSGIHVQFNPEIIKHGKKSTSDVTISVDKDAIPGNHLISIVCNGSDGKEHICKLTLNVGKKIN